MAKTELADSSPFPTALLNWASHKEGGVRRAFVDGGRPTGDVIETPIVKRLTQWIDHTLQSPTQTPRAVLLVGGPGNGKTDSVEQAIGIMGERLDIKAEMFQHFAAQIEAAGGAPPRLMELSFNTLLPELVLTSRSLDGHRIQIVQDASVSCTVHGRRPEAIEELRHVQTNPEVLYICCLNRGILADALTTLRREGGADEMVALLAAISRAVAQGKMPKPCWPLEEYPWLAVWPMDADSLLTGRNSPAHQIFAKALVPKWADCPTCEAAELCPFRTNREALGDGSGRLDKLLVILRRYELASGKRWTFRDVLSLVPELLLGNESDFRNGDSVLSPCDWVREQVADLQSTAKSNQRKGWRARLQLSGHLYQQALFPAWPDLQTLRSDMYALTQATKNTSADREVPREVFLWLSRHGLTRSDDGGQIQEQSQVRSILFRSLTPLLEPALTQLDQKLTPTRSVRDLDSAFSRSVKDGIKACGPLKDLSSIDRKTLELLHLAEEALSPSRVPFRLHTEARQVRNALRQLACRFTKRSVLTRRGLTRDHILYQKYEGLTDNPTEMARLRREFNQLLNSKYAFQASVVQSLGQPQREPTRDVVLVTRKVSTTSTPLSSAQGSDKTPATTPFLQISEGQKTLPVALTFQLFQALNQLTDGIYPGCLSPEVTALIQQVKFRVVGRRVRDDDYIYDDDTYLALFGGSIKVELLDEGHFALRKN